MRLQIAALAEGGSWSPSDYKPDNTERSSDWNSQGSYSSNDNMFHMSGSDNDISYQ